MRDRARAWAMGACVACSISAAPAPATATATGTATAVDADARVLAPGQASNPSNREARVSPLDAVVPDVTGAGDFGLPADSVVAVRTRLAVNREGVVVDAESDPASLLRIEGRSAHAYAGADLTPDQASLFEASARVGILASRFSIDPAVSLEPGDLVRGAITVWWLASGQVDLPVRCMTTVQRSERLLLADGCPEPLLVSSILWPGRQRGTFRLAETLSGEDLDAARGIPVGRRIPAGEWGCGLLADAPANVFVSGGDDGLVPPQRLAESGTVGPAFPKDARELKIGGSVTVSAVVDPEGKIVGFLLLQAMPGFPSMLESVMDDVCQWRYQPATLQGVPVMASFVVNVNFLSH